MAGTGIVRKVARLRPVAVVKGLVAHLTDGLERCKCDFTQIACFRKAHDA